MPEVNAAVYRGTCDASAAVRVGHSAFFITASDEDYILRVYDHSTPGAPVATRNVQTFLRPSDPKKEADIEGAAQIGDDIYWIASHSCDKEGAPQESRQRFFATSAAVRGGTVDLQPIGKPYSRLLADLLATPALAGLGLEEGSRLAPEAEGGLNIEGLAPTRDGQLFIGFRNPIPQGKALIVRLHNASDLIRGRAEKATLSVAGLLDLEGRGIRAIEFLPEADKYLLIAGSFNDQRNFRVYIWSGGDDRPLGVDILGLNELNPEELVAVAKRGNTYEVELFSDDGDAMVGEKKCKKVEEEKRSFRGRTVHVDV